jgi:hypothetical protein
MSEIQGEKRRSTKETIRAACRSQHCYFWWQLSEHHNCFKELNSSQSFNASYLLKQLLDWIETKMIFYFKACWLSLKLESKE